MIEIFDQVTLAWDKQKLETFFPLMDREVIFNIPLSTRRQGDFWAWHYDKKGFLGEISVSHDH
jgi:hypothetical protein